MTRSGVWSGVGLLIIIVASPAMARRLDCAGVRAALARGRSPAQVAIQFQTTTQHVLECKRGRDHGRHLHDRRRPTPTAIPERTDFPTPAPTLERPRRGFGR